MVEANIQLEYLPKQGAFLRNCSEVTYNGYIGGFGSGKTHILVIEALLCCGGAKTRGCIGAPTYRMLEDTTQQKFFELCPLSWIKNYSKSRNMVTLRNGTEVLFRSMDNPGRLASLELNWFGIDEAGLVKEDTFKMLVGRLRSGGIRRGFVVGNPAGLTHWTYDYFVKLAGKHPELFRLVQAPTYDNTYLPTQYITDMETSFGMETAYFKQYVLGQFVAFEGAFWPNFNAMPYPTGHVMSRQDALEFSQKPGGVRYGRVFDFGFEHPFVAMWYMTDGISMVFFDEYVQKHGLIKQHCMQMRTQENAHQDWFGPHRYQAAWTDHEAVSRAEVAAAKDDDGKSIGFTCIPTEKKVMESILLVQALFGMRRLFITNNCERALREIPSYHCKGEVLGEEPERIDDDTCCCLRYASWSELQHSIPYKRYRDINYSSSDLEDVFDLEMEMNLT